MAGNNKQTGADWVHDVSLPNDHGQDVQVTGRLVAEDMHFNNTSGMLTVEKVFETEDGTQAYGVISAVGHTRERRAYTLRQDGENVAVNNGAYDIEFPVDAMIELLALALAEEAENARSNDCDHMLKKLAANT